MDTDIRRRIERKPHSWPGRLNWLLMPGPCRYQPAVPLKVDGNEKLGGLRFLQLLGISLGPWRSMSIFGLNMPFAIEKRISFSALSSKMNRRFVWQLAMRSKQDLPTYNAPIYLRTECSERKKRRGPNKKKIRQFKSGSVRQYNGAAIISPWFNLRAEQVFIVITRKYIDAPKFCVYRLISK